MEKTKRWDGHHQMQIAHEVKIQRKPNLHLRFKGRQLCRKFALAAAGMCTSFVKLHSKSDLSYVTRKTLVKVVPVWTLTLLSPDRFWGNNAFSANSGGEFRVAKSGALLHGVTVQLASHLDVLYIVKFSFKSNGSSGDQYVYLEQILVGVTVRRLGGNAILRECNPEGMEFLQKRIHSCASLAVSYVTPLTTSLENFRNQFTLYLFLIGTLNHGRVISYPLGMQPGGIAHSRALQVGDYSPRMHMPGNLEVQTPGQNPSPRACIPSGKPYYDTPY